MYHTFKPLVRWELDGCSWTAGRDLVAFRGRDGDGLRILGRQALEHFRDTIEACARAQASRRDYFAVVHDQEGEVLCRSNPAGRWQEVLREGGAAFGIPPYIVHELGRWLQRVCDGEAAQQWSSRYGGGESAGVRIGRDGEGNPLLEAYSSGKRLMSVPVQAGQWNELVSAFLDITSGRRPAQLELDLAGTKLVLSPESFTHFAVTVNGAAAGLLSRAELALLAVAIHDNLVACGWLQAAPGTHKGES